MAWIEPYPTQKGLHYRLGYYKEGRRAYMKAGNTPEEAERFKAAFDKRNEKPKSLTVGELAPLYLKQSAHYKQASTVYLSGAALAYFVKRFKRDPVNLIQRHEIQRFINQRLDFQKTNGLNIVIRNIRTFFNWCISEGYLAENPTKGIKQFKIKPVARFLERSEMALLYKMAPKRLRRAYCLFLWTGLRRGEFLSLKPESVKLSRFLSVSGKTGARLVPFPARIRRIIQSAINHGWHVDGLEQAHRMNMERVKIGRVRLHDLRHTFCSIYLQNGGSLADLMAIMGHKNLSTLQIYAHFQSHHLYSRVNGIKWDKILVKEPIRNNPVYRREEGCVSGLNGSPGKTGSDGEIDEWDGFGIS